jgi:uncharacterized protein
MESLKTQINRASQFVITSFAFSLSILFLFIFKCFSQNPDSNLWYGISTPTFYFFPIFILTILFSPFMLKSKLAWIVALPKILFDIFLVADLLVFNTYRFHIDMLFIEMAIFDFKGIGLSTSMVLFALIGLAVIALFNLYILFKVDRQFKIKSKFVVWPALIVLLAGQLTHVWGYYTKQRSITIFTPYLPYYAPLTSSSKMSKLHHKYPELIQINMDDKASTISNSTQKGILDYPQNELLFDEANSKPNVLMVVVESWRFDMTSQAITPNIHEFSKISHTFNNHYSGGNVTVSGLFSLMYGLSPSYLSSAQSAPFRYQTSLTKSFEKQGYDIASYSASNFNRFSLKPMFFGDISDSSFIYPTGIDSVEGDKVSVDSAIEHIKSKQDNPWFKFIFLTSSHHDYRYPNEYKKFTPIPKVTGEFLLNKHINEQPFLNDYKNSLHYIDHLFSKVLTGLKDSGKLDNTVIILTSDHGEEFNDNKLGFWGHGSNFTKYQTKVPLFAFFPNSNHLIRESKRSSHVDIVPTLLKNVLKVSNPIADYSTGYDLFDLPKDRNVIMTSYKDKAYLIDDTIYSSGMIVDKYSVENLNDKKGEVKSQKINELRSKDNQFIRQ